MFLIVSEDEGVTCEIQNGKSMQYKYNAFYCTLTFFLDFL